MAKGVQELSLSLSLSLSLTLAAWCQDMAYLRFYTLLDLCHRATVLSRNVYLLS